MDERFDHIDLDNEKVHKIILSAFEVFSKNDLEKASTNMVVKQAGISRGLLYHYFKDKQELFDFLMYFAVKTVVVDMEKRMDWDETDIFNRMRQSVVLRFELMEKYPYMLEFFAKYSEKMNRIDIRNKTEEMAPGMRDKFYNKNLDLSQVKEGVDIQKMMNVIKWTLKGLGKERWDEARLNDNISPLDGLLEECDIYIEFLKKQFLK